MGQVLHGSATTTEAIRRAIQHSEASLRTLAARYGINQKTVAKWKRRTSVADVPTGPRGLAQRRILDLAATIVVPERVALGREDRRNGLDPQRDRDRDRPMHTVMG